MATTPSFAPTCSLKNLDRGLVFSVTFPILSMKISFCTFYTRFILMVKIVTFYSVEFVFLPAMSRILNIETATDVCSVSISEGGETIAIKERTEGRSHATLLSVFIRDLFSETGFKADDLDAVAVSQGPGSYTGLRIGVSTAKGICYGSKIPLIAVPSLESLTAGLVREFKKIGEGINESAWLMPMIDARRMEVYTASFDYRLNQVQKTQAMIIEPGTFNELASAHSLILCGSGAEKLIGLLNHPNIQIIPGIKLSALDMAFLAEKKFRKKSFEDLAYFEPYYLKDFMTTTPKKKII